MWFLFLGPAALVIATILAGSVARQPSWLVWQLFAGAVVIVLAWQIGDWAGAFEDEDPEGCSDCGEMAGFALAAVFLSCVAWVLGTALGGAIGCVVRRRVRRSHRPRGSGEG